jgi:hypothetical protein
MPRRSTFAPWAVPDGEADHVIHHQRNVERGPVFEYLCPCLRHDSGPLFGCETRLFAQCTEEERPSIQMTRGKLLEQDIKERPVLGMHTDGEQAGLPPSGIMKPLGDGLWQIAAGLPLPALGRQVLEKREMEEGELSLLCSTSRPEPSWR